MLSSNELAQFARACTNIGNEIADSSGFVSVRNLLARFNADLIMRPLLVEGMLVSIDEKNIDSCSNNRWAVLLDSETYPFSESDVALENTNSPLPVRMRNTIAHELVHALAFRPTEFGIKLTQLKKSNITNSIFVKEIEEQTEKFSPLLLWSENSLEKMLSSKNESLEMDDLTRISKKIGISRHILVNRFKLSSSFGKIHNSIALKNFAVGIGEWINGSKAVLRSWPIYCNFDSGVIPNFLHQLIHQDRYDVEAAFSKKIFSFDNKLDNSVNLEVDASVFNSSIVRKMKVNFSFEKTSTKAGSKFLFVVRKTPD
jgi:hypothetical protein